MKILVLSSLYPDRARPRFGMFVRERVRHIAKRPDYDVTVLSPVPYVPAIGIGRRSIFSRVPRQEILDGIPIHHPRYAMLPKVSMPAQALLMLGGVLGLARRLERERGVDIIDAHYAYPDGCAGVLLGRLLDKPVVVTARGSDINVLGEIPLMRPLLRFTLRGAGRVIAVSRALQQAIEGLGIPAAHTSVIPNGVDASRFRPEARNVARRCLGLPEGQIVLSVGNLTPNKGFGLLVRAFSLLHERTRTAPVSLYLVGAGGGPEADVRRAIARVGLAGQVRLVGDVPHDDLRFWYSAADVFCLASGREGWPNVILEALACGTPVVATRVGGIPEIVVSDRLGLLVERDEAALADALSMALVRQWDRDVLVAYARRHSWDEVAAAAGTVLEKVRDEFERARLQTNRDRSAEATRA